ncbi:MAG: hypothetical protein ACYSWT_07690 [Planctomycetota bacterium]|jgi:hypothetical protein
MHLWGLLQARSFSPEARVTADVPCQGCGYNLREAKVSGACPECGRRVSDSLVPLDRPQTVAAGLRYIGNSYLGLLALPLVPISALAVSSCAGWVGIFVLLATSIARASGVADLRFRASTGQLPVIGPRVGLLWLVAVADVALVGCCLLFFLAGAAGDQSAGWVQGVAMGLLGFWIIAASVVAAVAGWMGTALAAMLGYAPLARRLHLQWRLMAAGPLVAAGLTVVIVMLTAVGGVPGGAGVAILGFMALGVMALAVLWLIGLGLTLSGMSELARVVERTRDVREGVVSEAQTQSLPGQARGPGPRPC